jgi:DNA-binding PadR family transcriptional regulator
MAAIPDLVSAPDRPRSRAVTDSAAPDSNADYVSTSSVEAADSPWGALRRVHFYINDLIFCDLHPLGVGVNERRVLDALAFADARGATDGLPVAAICKLIPPRTTPQTVGSVLGRVQELGWVDALEASLGRGRGRPWRLNDRGRELRAACKRIIEMILQENYHRATTEQRDALLAFGQAAAEFMDSRLGPVMHRADPAASVEPQRRPNWAALRRAHFFTHDLIFTEVEPIGVGVVERRVLDALGFAAHKGATDGITTKTICALVCTPIRSQAATSVLARMGDSGWVESHDIDPGSRRGERLWRLTPGGQAVRRTYKEYAESVIRNIHGRGASDLRDLLALAQRAEEHRIVRLEPIVALAKPPGRW